MKIRDNDVIAILGQVQSVDEDTVTISIPDASGTSTVMTVAARAARIIGREFLRGDEVFWKNEKHHIENELSRDLFTLKRVGALEGEASSYVIAKSSDLTHAERKSMFRFQSLAEAGGEDISERTQSENDASVALLERTLERSPAQIPAPMRMSAASFSQDDDTREEAKSKSEAAKEYAFEGKEPEEALVHPPMPSEATIEDREVPATNHNDLLPAGMNSQPKQTAEENEIVETENSQAETFRDEARKIVEENNQDHERISVELPEKQFMPEDDRPAQESETDPVQAENNPAPATEPEVIPDPETSAEPARQLPEESPIRQQTLENLKEDETKAAEGETKSVKSALDRLD